MIHHDGAVLSLLPQNVAGTHCQRYDTSTIGILLVGGRDTRGNVKFNYSKKQKAALLSLLTQLQNKYVGAEVCGAGELNGGLNPYFNVSKFYEKSNPS